MRLFVCLLAWFLRDLALANLALRQQLATYARGKQRPRLKREERAFWAALSRVWQDWRSPLMLLKPATVIDWHRRGFRRYWRWRSRGPGRPRIPDEHIALIRRINIHQPGWGEARIAEELAIKLGVRHAASAIRRYMVRRRKPWGGQTWKTFVRNHASQMFAIDFLNATHGLFHHRLHLRGDADRLAPHRGCKRHDQPQSLLGPAADPSGNGVGPEPAFPDPRQRWDLRSVP
jgi:hypothetical protein